ncbi:transporter substrate-binding domain-containing protein [Shimia sp. R9_2]|uniref:substrate-binding periplasmic protein n=1 Tax=Shimia sp. R9_2 TaxID=2821112 RepID=UPI001ADA064F|nr:transporter substrate-binding domain-containing protein [Shimia sp. R9_2]MBO9395942.1 transporter substrate-binding domain-containing protein [Shimia sp. R9_2]
MKTILAAGTFALASLSGTASLAETLVVGVENIDYLPHYKWDGNSYTGFAADVLSAFAADEGHELQFKALPINRLMQAVVSGDVDLKYPDNAYWSAGLKSGVEMHYSTVVESTVEGVMVVPENLGKPVDEIAQIGTVLGFTAFSWLDRIEAGQVTLKENPNFSGLVRQALAGRIDGAYANVHVLNRVLSEMGQDEGALVFDESLPNSQADYHLSSSTRGDIVDSFNAWFAANQDTVAALKEKHGF